MSFRAAATIVNHPPRSLVNLSGIHEQKAETIGYRKNTSLSGNNIQLGNSADIHQVPKAWVPAKHGKEGLLQQVDVVSGQHQQD